MGTRGAVKTDRPVGPPLAVYVLALVVVTGLLTLATRYGFHRDELYFVVAGAHPAFGYVDQPPLTPLLARGLYLLGDGSLLVVRLLPAVLAGAMVVLTAALARAFGGARRTQVVAAGAAACMPLVWNLGHLLSTATVDAVAWLAVIYAVVRRLQGGSARWWLVAGLLAGVALQNKHTPVILAIGLGAGFVSVDRDRFREPLLWAGLALALVMALPNLVWQAAHGWPQLEMAASLRDEHGGVAGGALAVALLALTLNPALLGRLVAGFTWLWRDPEGRSWRPLAVAAPVSLAMQLLSGGQFYYVAPWGLVLLAAGMVRHERRRGVANARGAPRGLVVPLLTMAILAPTVLPILPAGVADTVGVIDLNSTLGDQVGWPEFVATVEDARAAVERGAGEPPVVLTSNYGEAAALELAGIPNVHSGHNSYWGWGPPAEGRSRTVVAVGFLPSWVEAWCASPVVLDTIAMPDDVGNEEHGRPILRCERERSWVRTWPMLRHYN